jgi:ABC-type uncharacterized transport system YnjBCD ATPase subunit
VIQKKLKKTFPLNLYRQIQGLLHDVSGMAEPGKLLVIMGPSGKYMSARICFYFTCTRGDTENLLKNSFPLNLYRQIQGLFCVV